MAFKETQTQTRFLLIWLSFIQISGFVTFNEEIRFDSVGPFNKNAKEGESFDQVDDNPLSGAKVGRLVIWPDQTPNGDGGSLSPDLSSLSLPHNGKNTYMSGDAGWMKLQPLWGQVYGLNTLYTPTVERLLGMRPKVDCVGDLMTLTVHGKEAYFGSNFLIDRGSISPLPLSQLPSKCGHTLMRTWSDFIFNIPYNGCYVAQERNTYILPLLWWGLPVKMSCSLPTLAQSSPTVSCYTNGMIVKLPRPSINLKIKVVNEWLPLMRASAKCGYSVVSHPEGVVIHVPYMPCTEAKDRMFTLSMATEREFNLSCPALLLSLPSKESDVPSNNYTSVTQSLVSTTPSPAITDSMKSTQPIETPRQTTSMSSTKQKLSPSLTYQPYFKPISSNYPFLLFHPNVPPTVVPDPETVAPLHITQGPQASVYPKPYDPKPPQTLYPWYPKPNIVLPPKPTQRSFVPPYARKPLSPAYAPTPSLSPLVYLLKPTTTFPQDKTIPKTPPVQWAPMYPPSNLVYPLYPRKTFVDASSAAFAQASGGLYPSQSQPRPDGTPHLKPSEQYALPKPVSAPPIPAPTKRAEPLQFPHYPWYRPLPQHLEMPAIPVNVPQVSTASTPQPPPQPSKHPDHSYIKGPPISLHFDFTPSTDSTTAPSKITEVAHPTVAPQAQCNLSHALSFHCPTFCPGHPLISYHHHNHHHFGHPFPSTRTKITAEYQSPLITTSSSNPALFPFIKGMGYNYGPYLKDIGSPQAIQYLKETESPLIKSTLAPDTFKLLTRPTTCPHIFRTLASSDISPRPSIKPVNIASVIRPLEPTKPLSRFLQNAPIADPPAPSVQSPKPAVYYAEKQPYVPKRADLMPMFVAAPNNVGPLSQSEHRVFSKPTIPPANGKNLLMNYWYQAASYPRPPMSDAPSEIPFKQTSVYPSKPPKQSTTLPQPKQTHEMKPPMQLNINPPKKIHNSVPVHTQLYDPQSGTPPVPIFRALELFDSYWASAVQTNQKKLLSTHHPDGSKGFFERSTPLHGKTEASLTNKSV